MIRTWSIHKRLDVLAFLPVLLMSISLIGYFLPLLLDNAQKTLNDKAILIAKQLVSASEYSLLTNNTDNLKPLIQTQFSIKEVTAITIRRNDGSILLQSINKSSNPSHELSFIENVFQQTVPIGDFENELIPGKTQEKLIGTVEVIVTTDFLSQEKNHIIYSSTIIALITFIISILIAMINSRSISSSIINITNAVKSINAENLETNLHSTNGGELGALETNVNKLSSRLKKSKENEKIHLEEILRAKAIAENANNVKTEFLARMSHELRTPMNGTMGMLQLIEQSKLTKEQSDYVRTATQSMQHLLSMVNELLDFSKLENNKIQLDIVTFNLFEKISKITNNFKLIAENKDLLFKVSIEETTNWLVETDPIKLSQIMTNFIDNAIKFTERGEISISVRPSNLKNNIPTFIEIKISDTGIGIAKSKHATIFDAFVQADSSTTRKYGGSGLGLTISKEYIQLLNGELDVQSQPNKGTKFTIKIPAVFIASHETSIAELKLPKENNKLHGKVLVVEDDPSNQLVIKSMLASFGFDVETTNNGFDASELASQNPYKMIFMDCHMPNMNGLEATQKIKSESLKNSDTPIIAVTADIFEHTQQKCIEAGMSAYLTKPISKKLLLDSINELI